MSDHTVTEHDGHAADHAHAAGAHSHPGPGEYIRIGLILFLLTVLEVVLYYIEPLRPVLVPILMVVMVIKFAMVVMWFMHLKFDNRLFSMLFTAPLMIAICLCLALMALFGAFMIGGGEVAAVTGH